MDDRLAFFSYFASDKLLNQYTTLRDDERPDLAFFYDACVAWREREETDTVVIVEFKRPMREDYSKGKDPIQQVLSYVHKLLVDFGRNRHSRSRPQWHPAKHVVSLLCRR